MKPLAARFSPFTAGHVTDQKVIVRGLVYEYLAAFAPSGAVDVLILPGRAPEAEIRRARAVFARPTIIAVDRDPLACAAARAAGADGVIGGDLMNLKLKVDVAHVDLCSQANAPEIAWAAHAIRYAFAVNVCASRDTVRAPRVALPGLSAGDSARVEECSASANGWSAQTIIRYAGSSTPMLTIVFARRRCQPSILVL